MGEDKKELVEGIELTDDMLEGISGGWELDEYLKATLREGKRIAKANKQSESEFIEYLRTETKFSGYPPEYFDLIAEYVHDIWPQY